MIFSLFIILVGIQLGHDVLIEQRANFGMIYFSLFAVWCYIRLLLEEY